jgi:hypothetical protein
MEKESNRQRKDDGTREEGKTKERERERSSVGISTSLTSAQEKIYI